jgi:hypothetical protein
MGRKQSADPVRSKANPHEAGLETSTLVCERPIPARLLPAEHLDRMRCDPCRMKVLRAPR